MRCAAIGIGLTLCLSVPGWSADLSKIDRTIGKLPELHSKLPEYCLLVFGPQATKRVWLVHDGDVLCVDRNGNGDLTDPDERVEASAEGSKPEVNVFSFQVGEIPDEPRSHKDLRVYWMKLDHMRDIAQVAEYLDSHPERRGCGLRVDVAMEGCQGTGIEGRVQQTASIMDELGMLQFSSRPEDAPIVHFGGPWEVTLTEKEVWRVGRTMEVYLVFGTPGIGPGTTTNVAYEKIVPPALRPIVRVLFPPVSPGESPLTKSYELTRRCCTYNLYGDVKVPDEVGTGTAKIEISLDSWPGAYVAPSLHDVAILPAKPGPKLEAVSPRLVSKLPHDRSDDSTCNIHFSPDGKRLIAGDYPGGVVHVWDVASGKRLLTLEMGDGLRTGVNYFAVTPDWQKVISASQHKGIFEKIERDGKTLHRVAYSDSIRTWDLNTGKLLSTLRDSPPRSYNSMSLSPDGSRFFTRDEVPGEFSGSRPGALSLWDVATGDHRQIRDGNASVQAFSADSGLIAVSIPGQGSLYYESLKVFTMPQMTEVCTIPMTSERSSVDAEAFISDRRLLVGTVTVFDAPDQWWDHCHTTLKFWDTKSGQEVFSLPAPEKNSQLGVSHSPNGRTLVVSTYSQKAERQHLLLLDVDTRAVRKVELRDNLSLGGRVFHPSGKWMAICSHANPKQGADADVAEEDQSQPHIECLDLASGKIVESLAAPQAWVNSMAFSPDGNTLATSGKGAVLLWDFRSPPGEQAAAAGQ